VRKQIYQTNLLYFVALTFAGLPDHHILTRLWTEKLINMNIVISLCTTSASHVKTHKLLQVCTQVVANLFTSCRHVVFALLFPSCCDKFATSCEQFVTSLMPLSDLSQGWSINKSDTVMI
jgi:hypothetical protein